MAVHGNDEQDFSGPPVIDFTDIAARNSAPLRPGMYDVLAFPCLWSSGQPPYNPSTRNQLTRRAWARYMLYQQILPLVRSTQAAQEFILAIWSEIENFQLQAVRQQLTKFRLANIDDIRRNPNAEDLAKVIENVPASYTGVIHICDNQKIEYIFR